MSKKHKHAPSAASLEHRERLRDALRKQDDPGPGRVARLRHLGFLPEPQDLGAPDCATATLTRSRRPAVGFPEWETFAAAIRPTLQVGPAKLSIWLPGLVLFSENNVQRGIPKTREREHLVPLRVRHMARRNCLEALMSADLSHLHRIETRVGIAIRQTGDEMRTDPGNLYAKPLIDALLTTGGGLGIIQDDSRAYVSSVTVGYASGATTGVTVELFDERERP